MRLRLILLFVVLSLSASGQSYRCLLPEVKQYFANKDGYIRGIRIDSTKIVGDSTILFPYHTLRGAYTVNPVLDSTGASWVGKSVVLRNGDYIFDNAWGDSMLVRSQAAVADSWIFYRDTSAVYYIARVVSIDTMTTPGGLDSVKFINITVHDSVGIVGSDSLNNSYLLLSKAHGFVRLFDLRNFPYHAPGVLYPLGDDYFTDYVLGTVHYGAIAGPHITSRAFFNAITLPTTTYADVFRWSGGDVLEYSGGDGFIYYSSLICDPPAYYQTDTIIAVDSSGGYVNYYYSGIHARLHTYGSPFLASASSGYDFAPVSGTISVSRQPVFDTTLMPEEYHQDNAHYLNPADNSYCITGPLLSKMYFVSLRGNIYYAPFEVGIGPTNYKFPYGLLDRFSFSIDAEFTINSQTLVYSKIAGVECGTYISPVPTRINKVTAASSISIAPNPATDVLHISAAGSIDNVRVVNLMGQTVYRASPGSNAFDIDVSSFAPGTYVLLMNGITAGRFVKN